MNRSPTKWDHCVYEMPSCWCSKNVLLQVDGTDEMFYFTIMVQKIYFLAVISQYGMSIVILTWTHFRKASLWSTSYPKVLLSFIAQGWNISTESKRQVNDFQDEKMSLFVFCFFVLTSKFDCLQLINGLSKLESMV